MEQPKTLDERLQIVQQFRETTNFDIPILVDNMNDSFCNTLCVWPERYFVLTGTQFCQIASPSTEYGYDRLSLRRSLRTLLGAHSLLMSGEDHYLSSGSCGSGDAVQQPVGEICEEDVAILKHGEVVHSTIPYFYPTDGKVTSSCIPSHVCQNPSA